jgi:carbon-monoxide dehydrogenase medium subunit
MKSFTMHQPASLQDAVAIFGSSDDFKPLAGGMTLLPTMKQGLATPSAVIDLTRLADLAFIRENGATIEIGAMTTHATVAKSALVQKLIPALASLAGGIGDPAVRNRGTIGGSVANNDPAADYPAAVLGLGATIVTDRREIAADAFFTGMFSTALEADELITTLRFPIPLAAGYAKFRALASRYALVGVFVARFGETVRVAVTGAGPCVFRVSELELALSKQFDPETAAQARVSADGLNSDMHAEAAYRAHLIGVMARRAVQAATAA